MTKDAKNANKVDHLPSMILGLEIVPDGVADGILQFSQNENHKLQSVLLPNGEPTVFGMHVDIYQTNWNINLQLNMGQLLLTANAERHKREMEKQMGLRVRCEWSQCFFTCSSEKYSIVSFGHSPNQAFGSYVRHT